MNRSKVVVICVVVGLVVATAVAYKAWTASPTYTLKQAAAAARNNDLRTFERYVDVERVCERFVDDLMQTMLAGSEENAFSGLAAGMAMLMRPQLVTALEKSLERAVETGDFRSDEEKAAGAADAVRPYWRSADDETSGFRRIAFVRKQGAIAMAGLEMYDAESRSTFTIELKLRDLGRYYQIVEIANLNEAMETLRQAAEKHLDEINSPIRAELAKTIHFQQLSGWSQSDRWGIERKAVVRAEMRNESSETVTAIRFLVRATRDGEEIGQFTCVETERLRPGERTSGVWSREMNQFIDRDRRLFDGIDTAELDAEVLRVEFEDGRVLEVKASLKEG